MIKGCATTKSKVPNGELALSYNSTDENLPEGDACKKSSISSLVKGKIALVAPGGNCSFSEKLVNVKAAGGLGVVTYSSITNSYNLHIGTVEGVLPFVMISYQDRLRLLKAFQQSSSTILKFNYSLESPFIPNEAASTISSTSSIGPTVELNMKPDIAAIGEKVYSTLPGYLGGYGFMSGTSMACPYVAGSVALYLQYHGFNSSSRFVFEMFKNYASQTNVISANSGIIDSTLRQGAGLIQVYDSITQVAHASPAQISFNDTSTTSYKTHNLTITNNGLDSVSYRLYNNVSVALSPYNISQHGNMFVPQGVNVEATADVQFSVKEIHMKPGDTQTVTVVVHPPLTNPLDHIMYSGYIQFYPFNQIGNNASSVSYKPLHVPYSGVVGSQHDLPIFDPSANITTVDKMHKKKYSVPTNITFDLTANATLYHNYSTSPYFITIEHRLITPTSILKAEVLQWPQGEVLGFLVGTDVFLQRNKDSNPFKYAFWNGYYINPSYFDALVSEQGASADQFTRAPSGDYSIRLSALKLFGDQRKEADWETWSSGLISIIQS